MLIYPLGGLLIIGAVMCGINPVMGMINTAMTNWLNALGGSSKDPRRAPQRHRELRHGPVLRV